jgi:hypothetical protein
VNLKLFFSVYRQLLTGVGNLRVIASTLENSSQIQDHTGDFFTRGDGSGGGGGGGGSSSSGCGDIYDENDDDDGPAL